MFKASRLGYICPGPKLQMFKASRLGYTGPGLNYKSLKPLG